jgi:hypothetical protein
VRHRGRGDEAALRGAHHADRTTHARPAKALSGGAEFSTATSYTCYGSDPNHVEIRPPFAYFSGSEFEAFASSGDEVRFACIGTRGG